MGSLGTAEILVVLFIALLVLGPDRLPEAARTAGRWLGELRRITGSLQAEVQDVMDEVMRPVHEATSTTTAGPAWAESSSASAQPVDPTPGEASTATGGAGVSVHGEPAPRAVPFDPTLN